MPGISLGVEGSTGLYIRGGTPDQNLVLLDGAPVYNLSHFGSFLSVFNTDAIKHFEVYKSGWPAQYGGRLSGLVDIHSREGNLNQWQGKLTLSPLLGRFLLEGPLKQEKTSLLLSGRSSWLGALFNLMSGSEITQRYLMYDLNAKITHLFNNNNRLYISYYSSLDDSQVEEEIIGGGFGTRERLSYNGKVGVKWGNHTASLRYASFLGKKWTFQQIVYYTRYRYVGYTEEENSFTDGSKNYSYNENMSANRDIGLRSILSFDKLRFGLKAGLELVDQLYQPQSAFVANNDSSAFLGNAKALQQNYFLNFQYHIRPNWLINTGLRYVLHRTADTTFYALEPRLLLTGKLMPQFNVKVSANYGKQYIHLLTGGNVGPINEIWMGSTARTPPQRGSQLSTGLLYSSSDAQYALEIEFFYRWMNDLVELKSISDDELTNLFQWEDLLETSGQGRVKGCELLLRKQTGRLTGWIAYTWSKNSRRFDNINRGNWFPARFDRRHDLALVFLYSLSERWKLSATWIYQTGNRITLPVARIPNLNIYENDIFISGNVNINQGRNNVQLPAYHRLDLSATYTWKSHRRQLISELGFSIYNAYNQINPYYIRTEVEPVYINGKFEGYSAPKVVVVGLFPFIPSLSFSRSF
jgi:hypothetical protein